MMSRYYNYKTGMLIFLMSLIAFIVLMLTFYYNEAMMGNTPQAWRYIILGGFEAMLLLPLVLYVIGNKKSLKHTFRIRPLPQGSFRDILFTAIGMFFLAELVNIAMRGIFHVDPAAGEHLRVLYPLNFVLLFIVTVVVTPVVEEAVFRGYLLRVMLRNKYRPFLAILLSSLIFTFSHLSYWNAPAVFLAGMILGYVAYKFYSIIPCIIIHAVFNLMVLIDINIPQIRENILYAKSFVVWVVMAGGILMLLMGLLNIRQNIHIHRKRRHEKEGSRI
jgi:membrane protease YdiL (CAAX protease family)